MPPPDFVGELGLWPRQEEPQVDGEPGHVQGERPLRGPHRVPTDNLRAIRRNLKNVISLLKNEFLLPLLLTVTKLAYENAYIPLYIHPYWDSKIQPRTGSESWKQVSQL